LRLAQSTISAQVKALEESLGEQLFTRSGRRLELTEVGRIVFRYADEIFSLGRELQDTLQGRPAGRPLKLEVGIADVVPKLVVMRLLEPALSLPEQVQLVCREDKPDCLIAALASHNLDVVLSDAPVDPSVPIRAFSHLLGECGTCFFAIQKIAASCRRGFPKSLDDAPMLLPTENTMLRRSLEQWFSSKGIRPRIVGEFEDSALLRVFGQIGAGVFPATAVLVEDIKKQHRVQLLGQVNEVRQRFYAISVERRIKHPAVLAISEQARQKIFG
jgi:LysR family transcriptional activator of nhaA